MNIQNHFLRITVPSEISKAFQNISNDLSVPDHCSQYEAASQQTVFAYYICKTETRRLVVAVGSNKLDQIL